MKKLLDLGGHGEQKDGSTMEVEIDKVQEKTLEPFVDLPVEQKESLEEGLKDGFEEEPIEIEKELNEAEEEPNEIEEDEDLKKDPSHRSQSNQNLRQS